jgi:hypothetical protein
MLFLGLSDDDDLIRGTYVAKTPAAVRRKRFKESTGFTGMPASLIASGNGIRARFA